MSAQQAAFFRLEGALTDRGVVAAAAYFATSAQGTRERVFRLAQTALAAPVFHVLGQSDRATASRIAYLPLRGLSEDRVHVVAEEYVDRILSEHVLPAGVDLVKQARRDGRRTVLLAESIGPIVRALLPQLPEFDDIFCNEVEFRNGECTGRLLDPIVGGHDVSTWVREYGSAHDIDLTKSVAYGAHGPDLLLLAAVGQPCAVNPDYTLRRAANGAAWPILDYVA